jgi:hypothetical protein
MYKTTPGRPSPRAKEIPQGLVTDFCALIEDTPADEWQKRSSNLRKLVDAIPEGASYTDQGTAWYNSPAILRHLALPIGELLKDPRSTVVKRTCESLTRLFIKCQTDARYLFKDIMPTILSVHAQTVQVIRTAVQSMILEVIPEVPCKMVMPLWMERLKVDKSRTVREACALYLGHALKHWTEEGYLTDEIFVQVGNTLLRTLRDPSTNARMYAKNTLERIRFDQPRIWERLLSDLEGPCGKDPKLGRWLSSLGSEVPTADAEELSVASKFSYNSDTRFAARSSAVKTFHSASPSPRNRFPPAAYSTSSSPYDNNGDTVPTSINFLSPQRTTQKRQQQLDDAAMSLDEVLGDSPPQLKKPFQKALETPPHARAVGTPPLHPSVGTAATTSKPIHSMSSYEDSTVEIEPTSSFPSDLAETFGKNGSDASEKGSKTTTTPKRAEDTTIKKDAVSFDLSPDKEDDRVGDDGPFIASMQELKKHASQRRSLNSMLMQERFKISGSLMDLDYAESIAQTQSTNPAEVVVTNGESDATAIETTVRYLPPKVPVSAPEHMIIAIRLLRAHKAHVDQIMETLKIEMDTLRDFDKLLERPGRPTEEEVLDYFESVGLCLDQRTVAGSSLQREMDRISRGEPPQE